MRINCPNMWLPVNHPNKHFVLKLISLTVGNYKSVNVKLQNSGQLQNNFVNAAVNGVIKLCYFYAIPVLSAYIF